jgi:hypothetical protein
MFFGTVSSVICNAAFGVGVETNSNLQFFMYY